MIFGFAAGNGSEDKVMLSAFANVNSFADILARATQVNADTVINFGNGDTLTLRNTLRSSLSADDFRFSVNSRNDFDGNGTSDILWQNDSGTPAVWLMNGTGVAVTGPALTNPGPAWHVKDAGDFNGDGKADILWQNDNGTAGVWLMNGVERLGPDARAPIPGPSWHATRPRFQRRRQGRHPVAERQRHAAVWLMDGVNVLATGPALAQSRASLGTAGGRRLQRRRQGRHSLAKRQWHAGGLADGRRNECRGGKSLQSGPDMARSAAGDFDGDGKADILWQNDNGTPAVWLMDGVNVLSTGPACTIRARPGTSRKRSTSMATASADIMWQHDNGTPAVWLMDSVNVLAMWVRRFPIRARVGTRSDERRNRVRILVR